MTIDLPLVWAVIIALAVGLYVLLDGFDLGVGILFPFARDETDRTVMMNTVAPVWDGNETWLVLGGVGLMGAFPLAYAVLMPALYIPVMMMLAALVLRGVAFEFRIRGRKRGKAFWTGAFAFGSTVAALSQGFALGGFIQGVKVENGAFAGGPLDWLTPYTALVAAGLVAGYAFLGAGWLIIKTEDEVHGDARRWAGIAIVLVAAFLAAVSGATTIVHPAPAERWGVTPHGFEAARFLKLSPIPLIGVLGLVIAAVGLWRRSSRWPFAGAVLVFLSGYLGLAAGFVPYVAPYSLTYEQAAAAPNALQLLLFGAAILLPMILLYTVFAYWTFRGKVTPDAGYH